MKGLFKKFMEFAVGNATVLVLGLLSTRIITDIIGPRQLAKHANFTLVTSLIVLIVMIGLDQAYIRYYHEEDEINRGKLLRQCLKIPLIMNLCVGLVTLFFYKPISNYIAKENSLILVVIVLIHTTFTIISNFVLINIRMKQRGKLYSIVTSMNKVFYLIIALILYTIFGKSYKVVVIAFVLANIAMVIMGVIFERKDWFSWGKDKKLKTDTKTLLQYGSPFIFSMSIIWVFQSIDKISLNSDDYQLGIYAAAMMIIGMMNTIQGAFTTFWVPVAYERYSTNPEDTEFFSKINEIVSFVMILIAIGLIAAKDLVGFLVLGAESRDAVFVIPFLVFMPIMYTISETTVLGINFNKKTKYHIYVAIFAAISNIIGNSILVPKMGATGAAISTGFSYIVFFLARTYFAGKFYKIRFKLGKFWVSIVTVYILAIYSSLYTFNIIIFLLTIASVAVVLIMYKNVVLQGYALFKKFVLKK